MKRVGYVLLGFALACMFFGPVAANPGAQSANKPGLFINLATDDTWAAAKAIYFAHEKVLGNGYGPVTIWLNVRGVTLADRTVPPHTHGVTGTSIHAMLQSFIADGGTVIACRACASSAGIDEDDLIDGVVMGRSELTLPALFDGDVRTLSW